MRAFPESIAHTSGRLAALAALTLLGGCTDLIAKEEVFGPVLSVLSWRDERTLMRDVNDVIYGVTASIWTRDLATAHRLAVQVEAVYVWVNGVARHYAGLPFGGWKQSGLGPAEHMDELIGHTQTKAVSLSL